jgi:anti-sigma regulatory factor (Ser/Thr protein kinase)
MIQHGPDRPHELELDMPAAHSAQRHARAMLRKFAQHERVPAKEVETLEFVASELLANAVDHGGGERAMEESDLKRRVRMTLNLSVRKDGWTLRVGDQGGGDPDKVAPLLACSAMPDLEDERGRGFFLLCQMLDSLAVVRSRDGLGLEFVAERQYQKKKRA